MDDGVFETLKDAKILLALAFEKEIVNKFTRLIGIKTDANQAEIARRDGQRPRL